MKLLINTRENTDTNSDKNYKRLSNSYKFRTYAKTPYIAHDNFDELHYSHVRSPNYFYSKTFSFSSQITLILIEGCFN